MELELLFLFLGWIAIAVIAYTVYLNTLVKVNLSSTEETKKVSDVRFLYFSSTHCPWSRRAKPHWEAFADDLKKNPTTFGGKTVSLENVDGDNHPDILKTHKVTAYPTFKLIVDGVESEMTTMPSPDAFRAFLVKSLGPEENPKLPSSTK